MLRNAFQLEFGIKNKIKFENRKLKVIQFDKTQKNANWYCNFERFFKRSTFCATLLFRWLRLVFFTKSKNVLMYVNLKSAIFISRQGCRIFLRKKINDNIWKGTKQSTSFCSSETVNFEKILTVSILCFLEIKNNWKDLVKIFKGSHTREFPGNKMHDTEKLN